MIFPLVFWKKKKKNYVVFWCWSRARDECTPSYKNPGSAPGTPFVFGESHLMMVFHLFQLFLQFREGRSCVRIFQPTQFHYFVPVTRQLKYASFGKRYFVRSISTKKEFQKGRLSPAIEILKKIHQFVLVGCRLKFSYFVGSRLKFSIFVGCRYILVN